MDWVWPEVARADFGDVRWSNRLVRMIEAFSRQPAASVPEACGGMGQAKAAYRFWSAKEVTPAKILKPHIEQTSERAARHAVVLAVQDHTQVNFSNHPKTAGLGYLKKKHQRGMFLHNVLAVSPEGLPLGVLHQEYWVRDLEEYGKRAQRDRKITAEKESQTWLTGLGAVEAALPDHPCVVVVADREADLYDLYAQPRREGMHLLIRVREWQRLVNHPLRHVEAAIRAQPVRAQVEVEVPRSDLLPGRRVTLSLRWTSLEVLRPSNHPDRNAPPSLTLWFLLAEEEHPEPDTEAICWLLAFSKAIETLEDALQALRWYTYRWRVEQFHFVLKSGCRVEQLQLEAAERLEKAISTYSIVAWRLLHLTYQARKTPDICCLDVLPSLPWEVLHQATHPHAPVPQKPPTLEEAVRWIARLGGFLGRKRDGHPGVKTLWRGCRRLEYLATGYRLALKQATGPPASYDTYG